MKRILLSVTCLVPLLLSAFNPSPNANQFQHQPNDPKVKILALDGGGVRGVVTLTVLAQLQQQTGCQFHQDFEIFAGTSTGSMIAVMLATGVSVEQLLVDYETLAEQVFRHGGYGIFSPQYNPEPLKENIIRCLEAAGLTANSTLGDLPKTVVIPSVTLDNPQTGTPTFYCFENISTTGKAHKIVDVLLSATAAPTYFPAHDGRIDGGTGMNDPSLAAIAFAFKSEGRQIDDYALFSVGTGYVENGIKGSGDWGLLGWLFGDEPPLLDVMFDLNDQVPQFILSRIMGPNYMRFNFPLTHACALDDYKAIPSLIKETDQIITAMPEQWNSTCRWITINALMGGVA